MPIYEYQCTDCDHAFETLQKMSDAPLSVCPACDKPRLKKKISAPGFRLSGTGWYETDFKSDKRKNLTQSDSSEKSGDGKTTTEKTDKAKNGSKKASKASDANAVA